jgi:hypothetical protein
MDFANRTLRVFIYRFIRAFSSFRVPLLLIMVSVFVYSNISQVAEIAAAAGYPAYPWGFAHLTNDFICQLVFMAAAVVLFCDAPFVDEAQLYLKYRAKHRPWALGHTLYIVVLSFVFVFVIWLVSVISLIPELGFGEGWGKTWGAISRGGLGTQSGLSFSASDFLMGKYEPTQATVFSFLLEWACVAWLGLLSYAVNLLSEKPIGTFLSAGFVLLDITIANELMPSAYAFSPITLAQLTSLSGTNQSYGITLAYAVRFFTISIAAVICFITFNDCIREWVSKSARRVIAYGKHYICAKCYKKI